MTSPTLSLTKTSSYVDTDLSGDLSVGDVINYVITATNSGTANLTNVTVSDPFLASLSCSPTNGSPLAPSASIVCLGSYTVVAADLGTTISNTASATSAQASATPVTVLNPVAKATLSLTKTSSYADTDSSGDLSVGDVIN